MAIWGTIRKSFPTATLDICYGRETWGTINPREMQFIISKIEEYKTQGVTEHGKIGHLQLAEIMKKTSVWAYPCNTTTETFCITAVKCQAAGCIPVTTRIGALDETIHPEAPQIDVIANSADLNRYGQTLFNTFKRLQDNTPEEISKERQKYMDFARQFSWSNCVDKWLQLFYLVK